MALTPQTLVSKKKLRQYQDRETVRKSTVDPWDVAAEAVGGLGAAGIVKAAKSTVPAVKRGIEKIRKSPTPVKTSINLLGKAGKAAAKPSNLKKAVRTAGRIGGRVGGPLLYGGAVVMESVDTPISAADPSSTSHQIKNVAKGYAGALKAGIHGTKTRAHTARHYGTVAKATATRKRKEEAKREARKALGSQVYKRS